MGAVLGALILVALLAVPVCIAGEQPLAAPVSTGTAESAGTPVRLFGRIEELKDGTGATIPLKMQAMTPIMDSSVSQAGNKSATDAAASDTYPIELRGSWSGELTIVSSGFDKAYFEFDRVEANRQVQLLKPGIRGFSTVTFYKGPGNKTELEPCHIVFVTTLNGTSNFTYVLHLGNNSGTGVTGNELKSQLMKNTLKQLAAGVLEQEIVTRDIDHIPNTQKTKIGYSESVLRFTRVDPKRIYLEAASVSYDSRGKFHNKVMLSGTLTRARS